MLTAQLVHTNGLSCAAPASSTAGFYAVLLQVSPICVTGSRVEVHGAVAVVLGPLVLVHDAHANWSTESDTKLCTRLDLDSVLFISGGGDGALSWSSPRHLGLNIRLFEFETWRASIYDTADTAAMRLAVAVVIVSN